MANNIKNLKGKHVVIDKKERKIVSVHDTGQSAWSSLQDQWFSKNPELERSESFERFTKGKYENMRKYIKRESKPVSPDAFKELFKPSKSTFSKRGKSKTTVRSHARRTLKGVSSVKRHGRNLNPGLQKHIIRKKIRSLGVDPDLYDINAHHDKTLTLNENLNKVKRDISLMNKRFEGVSGGRVGNVDRYEEARDLYDKMTPFRQKIDRMKQANNIFDVEDLNKRNFKKWVKKPRRYDIVGVDSKYG